MIQTRLLADNHAWHQWTREQMELGLVPGYFSPPEDPCVVTWAYYAQSFRGGQLGNARALSYTFVTRRDIPEASEVCHLIERKVREHVRQGEEIT
jgi:hypothetical protein